MTLFHPLDFRVIGALTALNALAIAITMLIAARGYSGIIRNGMNVYGFSKLFLVCGLLLAAQRGLQPDWLTIVVANTVAVLAVVGNYIGIRIVLSRSAPLILFAAIAAVSFLVLWIFTEVHPDVQAVRVFISGVTTVFLVLIIYELLVKSKQPGLARIVGGYTVLVTLIATLFRIVSTLNAPDVTFSLGQMNETEQMFFIVLFVTASIGGVNFSLLCNDVFNAELRELAATDPLSGLANRRSLLERGADEVNRSHRFQHAMSLLMIDIDHFKAINDTRGHAVGDLVIKHTAATFTASIRDVDMVARWGCEEFIVILPETGIGTATEIGDRLRQIIYDAPVLVERAEPIRYSVSIGVAQLREDETIDSLIERTDKAMYTAKQNGRNRVAAEC